jgi:hypothetical protein
MPRKPRFTTAKPTGKPANTGPLALSPEAQRLYDKIALEWELSPAVEALLRLAAEAITKAGEAEEITRVEGLVIGDAKGAAKPHPAALLARDYRAQASGNLQRLLAHLEKN